MVRGCGPHPAGRRLGGAAEQVGHWGNCHQEGVRRELMAARLVVTNWVHHSPPRISGSTRCEYLQTREREEAKLVLAASH